MCFPVTEIFGPLSQKGGFHLATDVEVDLIGCHATMELALLKRPIGFIKLRYEGCTNAPLFCDC